MKLLKLLVSIFLLMCVGAAYAATHPVVNGDCLEKIAKANNSTVRELLKLNKQIKNPDLIYVNDVIELPSVLQPKAAVETPNALTSAQAPAPQITPQIPAEPTAKAVVTTLPKNSDLDKFLRENFPKIVATQFQELVEHNRSVDVVKTDSGPVFIFATQFEGKEYKLYQLGNRWAKDDPKEITRYRFKSEIVDAPKGPAHYFDGAIPNHIAAVDAIDRLFPKSPPLIRMQLLDKFTSASYQNVSLQVGDTLARMLTAEGAVHEHVLQAQISDQPLPSKCFTAFDADLKKNYLFMRDTKSGNWYGEIIPSQTENTTCVRNRTTEIATTQHITSSS